MKKILIPAGAMLVIIAVQIMLSCLFTYHVGEVFTKVSMSALFFYYIIKLGKKARAAKAVQS
ncbi:MAG: hypothetical protein HFJ10_05825 [Lachnospiraceae bacterium]|nr:hypothetical protein [Lachnospiraceae bacterium]